MFAFILRRFVSMIVVLFCVITLTFVLVRLSPGNPFARERSIPPTILKELQARYNLDGTIWDQYTAYLGVRRNVHGEYSGILQGDFQPSVKYRDRSVKELLAQTLPVSATLGLVAFLLATTGGVWLGSMAAVRQHSPTDVWAMLGALFLISVPNFVVGPVLIMLFAIKIPVLPVGGWTTWSSLVLPAITLAGPFVAYIARIMRTSMLEVLQQDYVRTARAKGLNEGRVIYQHALKVAILPVVSYLGPLAASLVTGSIVVETIFNIPGAGPFFVNAINSNDIFLIEAIVIIDCLLLVFFNLVVDIAYTWLDRRIRLE